MSFGSSTNRPDFERSFAPLDAPDSYELSAKGLSLFLDKPSGKMVTQDHVNNKVAEGSTFNSTFTVLYGRVTYNFSGPAVPGVVSAAILLAQTNDEIDVELMGGRPTQWQTNIFAPAPLETEPLYNTFSSLQAYPRGPKTVQAIHSYTIDWNSERIVWSVDGSDVRTLRADVVGRLTRTILASSFIADLIRHLTISDISLSKFGFASVLPFMHVCKLPNLRTLTIQETTLVVNSAFCLAISKFTALTTLTLDSVTFANVAALGRVLAALPRLHDLKLNGVLYAASEMHMNGLWRGTAGPLDSCRMPRVRRLSITGGQIVGSAIWAVLELIAPHIECLVLSYWNVEPDSAADGDRSANRLIFGHLASLTLRAPHPTLMRGLDDFLSRSRTDQLRVVTLISCITLERNSDFRTMHRRLLENSSILERVVPDTELPQLWSLVIVAEVQKESRGEIVEGLEKLMPAVVEKCREKLSGLHRRGLLKVACATMAGERKDEALVWVAHDEGTHAAPMCVRQYGVSLLDAIVNIVDKAFL
ncbi:hypothetical protein V8D89_002068 [Ganoderma adspersum]